MSRGKRVGAVESASEGRAVGAFLRALAACAEVDAALAAQIATALRESGLLPDGEGANTGGSRADKSHVRKPASPAGAVALPEPPDPFVVFREGREAGLRATLDGLDLATLRQIVRAHRLDPARISARWAARERVIALIVDQVRARANHGKAFSRV